MGIFRARNIPSICRWHMNKKTSALVIALTIMLLIGTQIIEPTDTLVSWLTVMAWLLLTMLLVATLDITIDDTMSITKATARIVKLIVSISYSGMLLSILVPWLDGMMWFSVCAIPLAWGVWELTKGDDE